MTERYPYFLQEFGKHAWDIADGPDVISADDFERSVPLSIAKLDDSFFSVRAAGSTPAERVLLRAMARLGRGPVRTADVAKSLGTTQPALSPVRDVSSNEPCATSPTGEIAFTVPLFDDFMERWIASE